METEIKNLMDDILENAVVASENFKTEQSKDNIHVYDVAVKEAMEYERQTGEIQLQYDKLNFEQEKFEREMELKKEIEEAKLKIEEAKANNERNTAWAKVAIATTTMVAEIGLGVLYLKANMKYGGMIGKDAQKWFDAVKKVKL